MFTHAPEPCRNGWTTPFCWLQPREQGRKTFSLRRMSFMFKVTADPDKQHKSIFSVRYSIFLNGGVAKFILKEMMLVQSLSGVRLLATPWTAAHPAPPPMGFSRQEYWSGLPLPSLVSNFLEEISSLSHSIVFLYFFSLSLFISPCYFLELCIQMGIYFLFSTHTHIRITFLYTWNQNNIINQLYFNKKYFKENKS